MARSGGAYSQISNEEVQGPNPARVGTVQDDADVPAEPPSYDDVELGTSNIEQMDVDESQVFQEPTRIQRFTRGFKSNIMLPVREKIMDPLAQLLSMASDKLDFYLNKVGNPLILRRFVYIFFMAALVYYISVSGLLPNESTTGTKGMFSDKKQLVQYAKRSIDLSKLEQDLEYLSSMPHSAGTKGDFAIANYVQESFANNGIKLLMETKYETYLNYPGNVSLTARKKDGAIIEFELSEQNFNPLSAGGDLKDIDMVYGHYGTKDDYENLKQKGLLDNDVVLLLHYDTLVSEQILRAQEHGIKGILFVSDAFGDNKDVVQRKSVGLPQFGTGDPLTPGWSAIFPKKALLKESKMVPSIPSIPLSFNQGERLRELLSKNGKSIDFGNNWYSGNLNDVKIDLILETAERLGHPSWNVIGKVEGKEQTDKAIIIGAARDSLCNGATYPNFGTMNLLSLVQLFQQIKYKYAWKPLRNIYFISYDASQYSYAGATELLESELIKMKNEIYTVLDISQLGIEKDSNVLDIQTDPMLRSFFTDEKNRFDVDIKVRDVEQYGDWTPFQANGIPVAVLSAPFVLEKKVPIDTCEDNFDHIRTSLQDDNGWQKASNVLLYTFQVALKLVDEPMIPFSVVDYVSKLDELFVDLQKMPSEGLSFQPISDGLSLWKRAGENWKAWVHAWNNIVMTEDEGIEPSLLSVHRWTWNKKLSGIARRQCIAQGIPNRGLFKNMIFGPTLWTQDLYNSWSFPSIRDAINEQDWDHAQDQINLIGEILAKSSHLFLEESTEASF